MHKEYAVEPEAIGSDWKTFKDLIDRFGSDKGRLISRLPGCWRNKVDQVADRAGVTMKQRARITELLDIAEQDHKIVDFNRYYDSNADWIANALREHAQNPFDAIICISDTGGCAEALHPDDVDDGHPFLAASVSKSVARTADGIAKALFPLAMDAREIDIIDRYFIFGEMGEDYFGPFRSLLEMLDGKASKTKVIRVHVHTHPDRADQETVARNVPGKVQGHLPQGYGLELYEWQEHPNGEDFHDRYFLTDVGGIMVGAGFAAAGAQENATFSLLGFDHSQELREQFRKDANVYKCIGKTIRIKADGTTELLD